MTKLEPRSPIVIVGAGCFGLSTAYHLLKRGFTNVTVLDRAKELPAKDAASTDLNKSKMEHPGPLFLTFYILQLYDLPIRMISIPLLHRML